MKGTIIGLVIGAVLLVGGGFRICEWYRETGIVPVPTSHGVVGGNLALWMGLILMMAGVATLGGVLKVEIGDWEDGSDESPHD